MIVVVVVVVVKRMNLKVNKFRVVGMLLHRAVRTLQLRAIGELVEGITRDDMSARQAHRWIALRALLAKYGAGED